MSYFKKTKLVKYCFKYAYKVSIKGLFSLILSFILYIIYSVNFPDENDFKKGFLKKQLIGNQVYSRMKSSLFISCWTKISLLSDIQENELKKLTNWSHTPPFSSDDMSLDSRGDSFAQDCWDEIPSEYYSLLSEGTFEPGNFYAGVGSSYMVLFLPKHKLLLSMASHE